MRAVADTSIGRGVFTHVRVQGSVGCVPAGPVLLTLCQSLQTAILALCSMKQSLWR